MQLDEYDRMAEAEHRMWWYRGLHANLVTLLKVFATRQAGPMLDAGCGTGGTLANLAPSCRSQDRMSIGIDIHPPAALIASHRCDMRAAAASVGALPFADGSLAIVISADVLCQAGVEPSVALAEMFRCLKPGGTLLLQLPAYQWLRSYHDFHVHSARRFTRRRAIAMVRQAGFSIRFATYWNSILFPVMVLRRKLLPPQRPGSDVGSFPPWLDRLFRYVVAIETALIGRGIALPFGGSLLVVAERPPHPYGAAAE